MSDQIPYQRPAEHKTERVRAAIERAKQKANERDERRQA